MDYSYSWLVNFTLMILVVRVTLTMLKIKSPLIRVTLTVIVGALFFQLVDSILTGFWHPFALLVLVIRIPMALLIAAILEIIIVSIKKMTNSAPHV